jgi:asparagine synthase (glutamine-hydrolysing)
VCGIAGYIGLNDRPLLRAMAARLAHRGPDGEGLWADEQAMVGLAHRRLAIIDPTDAARQPMASCRGRYHVVFNGEIYNFRELGAELSERGYIFNSNSDTAVLGPLYNCMGTNMLQRLNGIFAFAIWDRRERELLLARDAFGVKPLYYTRAGRGLLFASELKALISYPDLDRRIDTTAIADYLVHLWSPGERTPFRSVMKLLPGHMLRARLDRIEVEEWYRPATQQTPRDLATNSEHVGKLTRQLGDLFDCAVADQCISDVPIGAFLSGGVDSSAIVAAMISSGNKPRHTYCIGFRGERLADEGFGDDLEHARKIAAKLDVPLTPILVEQPTADEIENLAYVLDEPQADPAPLYVAAISKAARADGIKVMLSGTGGDDVFSGYRRHLAAAVRTRIGRAVQMLSHQTISSLTPFFSRAMQRRLEKLQYMVAGTDEQFLLRAFRVQSTRERTRSPACRRACPPGCRAGGSAGTSHREIAGRTFGHAHA